MDYKYDITFSFAGEDREYVEQVAKILVDKGIKVFYDKFEEVDLWGKDLAVHFDFVYRKGAKYCVPFISENYKNKIWTNHEIKTAISRAIETNGEYILPAKFDDTEIDGIRPSLGFIDLRSTGPEDFANLIIKKLGKEPSIPIAEKLQENDGRIYLSANVLMSEMYGVHGCTIGVSITNTIRENRYFNEPYFKLSQTVEEIGSDSFYLFDKLAPVGFPNKLEHGQVVNVNYNLKRGTKEVFDKLPPETTIEAIVTTTLGEKFKSNLLPISDVLKIFDMIK